MVAADPVLCILLDAAIPVLLAMDEDLLGALLVLESQFVEPSAAG
jgi:hypothetical protein